MAFLLYSNLSNVWDGTSGTFLGKDWSIIGTLFEIYEVDYRREVFYFMKIHEAHTVSAVNEKAAADRKREERNSKASRK